MPAEPSIGATAGTITGPSSAACRPASPPSRRPPAPPASTTRPSPPAALRRCSTRAQRAARETRPRPCLSGACRTARTALRGLRGSSGPTARRPPALQGNLDHCEEVPALLGLRGRIVIHSFVVSWLAVCGRVRRQLRDDVLQGAHGGGVGAAVEGLRGLRRCAAPRALSRRGCRLQTITPSASRPPASPALNSPARLPALPPASSGGIECGGGGDVRVANCLWRFGFGPTLPKARPGRPELEGCVFGRHGAATKWVEMLDGYLYGGIPCDEECADALDTVVTTFMPHKARDLEGGRPPARPASSCFAS